MVDKRASDREFVSSIVDLLRQGHWNLTCPESEVRANLSKAITDLRDYFSSTEEDEEWFTKENRQYAKKLLRAVNRLNKLILEAPDRFFLPDERKEVIAGMGRLTDLCIYNSDSGGTSKLKRDWRKNMAASCALAAIKRFSNQRPSAGHANSTFASLPPTYLRRLLVSPNQIYSVVANTSCANIAWTVIRIIRFLGRF